MFNEMNKTMFMFKEMSKTMFIINFVGYYCWTKKNIDFIK